MGPVSRAAYVQGQLADIEFQDAVREEFRWIRGKLNHLTGEGALDKETIIQRLDRLDQRVSGVEKKTGTGTPAGT